MTQFASHACYSLWLSQRMQAGQDWQACLPDSSAFITAKSSSLFAGDQHPHSKHAWVRLSIGAHQYCPARGNDSTRSAGISTTCNTHLTLGRTVSSESLVPVDGEEGLLTLHGLLLDSMCAAAPWQTSAMFVRCSPRSNEGLIMIDHGCTHRHGNLRPSYSVTYLDINVFMVASAQQVQVQVFSSSHQLSCLLSDRVGFDE